MMDGVCRLSLMYCLSSVGLACLAGWRYLSTDKGEREREKEVVRQGGTRQIRLAEHGCDPLRR